MTAARLSARFRPSPTEVVCLILGELLVLWYAWIVDDAYVCFRYVDNLVLHHRGLVWNPGEYVEGFSSPLWVMLLASLRLLGLNYWLIIRLVGIACFAAFWWLACLINRRLSPSAQPSTSFNIPLIYLSFTYGVSCYFTSGLESPLLIVLAAVSCGVVLWPKSIPLQVGMGLSPLVRHELLVPYVILILYLYHRNRRAPLAGMLSCLLSLGPYLVFRVWYYADLLPNTYYLKNETWFLQGLRYLYDTVLPYQTVPYLLVAALLHHGAVRRYGGREHWRRERLLMLLIAAPVTFYVVKIGGDAVHFRHLAYPYCVVVLATCGLLESWLQSLPEDVRPKAMALSLVFALATLSNYPRQLGSHPLFRAALGPQHRQLLLINDAAVHRLHPTGITPPWWSAGEELSVLAARKRYQERAGSPRAFHESWCQAAFLRPANPAIHSLGLTEPFLARTRMLLDRPAHKWGLQWLAADIAAVRERHGFRRGAFDDTLAQGDEVPSWVSANIAQIRRIEQQAFNHHDLLENLRIALSRTPKIEPGIGEERAVPPGSGRPRAQHEPE